MICFQCVALPVELRNSREVFLFFNALLFRGWNYSSGFVVRNYQVRNGTLQASLDANIEAFEHSSGSTLNIKKLLFTQIWENASTQKLMSTWNLNFFAMSLRRYVETFLVRLPAKQWISSEVCKKAKQFERK